MDEQEGATEWDGDRAGAPASAAAEAADEDKKVEGEGGWVVPGGPRRRAGRPLPLDSS